MSSYYTGGSTPEDSGNESNQENTENKNRSTIQRSTTGSTVRGTPSTDLEDRYVDIDSIQKMVPTNYNTSNSRVDTEFKFQITLSYTVKSSYEYNRWDPQVPARDGADTTAQSMGNFDDTAGDFCPAGTVSLSDGPSKFLTGDDNTSTKGVYTEKTIEWKIGSSLPIKYGYHLDESPWVIDNGDLHLIEVGGDAEPSTGKNAWYEDFDINQTCINPDFGKMRSESIGQLSEVPGNISGFASEAPSTFHWAFDPLFTSRCIPESRGFQEEGKPVPYSDDDGDLLLSSIAISKSNRDPSVNTFGNGKHEHLWPVHFDGRGTLKSTSSIEQWNFYPRGSFLEPENVANPQTDSAAGMPTATKNDLGDDYYWMAAWTGVYNTETRTGKEQGIRELDFPSELGYRYDQLDCVAPYWREESWYGPDVSDPDANQENWSTLYTGSSSNRVDGGQTPDPSNSYEEVKNNTGLIKDRDDNERWSGIWSKNNVDSRKLAAHDLVVSSVSHVDPNAVSRGRRFWRARYNLYLALKGVNTEDGVYYQNEDGYNYLQFGSDANSGLQVTAREYNGNTYSPGDDYPPGVVDYELNKAGDQITEWHFWWSANNRPKYYVMPGENNSNGKIKHTDVDGNEIDIFERNAAGEVINNGRPFYEFITTGNSTLRPEYLEKDTNLNDDQYDTVQNDFIPGQGMPIYDAHGMWARAGAAWERKDYLDLIGCLSVVPPDRDLTGDINQDGIVDGADITALLSSISKQLGESNDIIYDPESDLNQDGIVDGADLTLLLAAWNLKTDKPYNRTFRPPLNWDPTDRVNAPYMEERDDIDEYTYGNAATSIPEDNMGQIGYPTVGMDYDMDNRKSNVDWAKVSWKRDLTETNDNQDYPVDLSSKDYFTLVDAFFPDPAYRDEPQNASLQQIDKYRGSVSDKPIYLRLGTAAPWFGCAHNDEKVSGFTSYYGAANYSYGSAKAGKDELHIALSCDRNLDFMDNAIVTEEDYPSLYWLNKNFGLGAEKNKKDINTGDPDYYQFGAESFSLRKKIRRAYAQRGIDHYGGYRSLGKVSNGNGGHSCWWDPILIWGLAVTGDQEYFDMLDKGGEPTEGELDPTMEGYDRASGPGVNIGSERTGTYKDLDFAYSAANRENRGTLGFMGAGALGPNGQQCFPLYTDENGDFVKYGKRSFYSSQLITNLNVKTVRDYDFSFRGSQKELFNDDYDSNNIYGVDSTNKQIFKNRLVTIHPPLGTNTGNVGDNVLWKLAELADNIGYDIDTSSDAFNINQCRRNFAWAPATEVYNNDPDEVKLDEVYNDLKSGVDPHSVVVKDEPYSILHTVSPQDIITINGVKFNTWYRYDSADGVATETVTVDTYVPHKSLNRTVGSDIRNNGRWSVNNDPNGYMGCGEDDGYMKDIPENEFTRTRDPRSGLIPDITKERTTFMSPEGGGVWARVNNRKYFYKNSYAGFYVKNMDNNKITRILAADLEIVTYREGFDSDEEWSGNSEGKPSETYEDSVGIDTRANNDPFSFSGGRNTQRALRCVLQDDIDLKADTPVEISPYIKEEAKTDLGMNWCNPNNPPNGVPARGVLTYSYAYYRGIFVYPLAIRMIAGLKNGDAPKPYKDILKKLPVYFQRQYPKYVSMWTTGSGRFGLELNEESTFGIHYPGGFGGNRGGGGNKENFPLPTVNSEGSDDGAVFGDYANLIRGLIRQQLVDVMSDRSVSAYYSDPTNVIYGKKSGKKGVSLKTRMVKWPLDEDSSNLNKLVDSAGNNVSNIDFGWPEMSLTYEDYASKGVSAISSNVFPQLFASTFSNQNLIGWDQLDGQQISFYWDNKGSQIAPKMQKPDGALGSAGSPSISSTIIGHPRVETAIKQYQPYSIDPDKSISGEGQNAGTHGPYLIRDDSGNIIANDYVNNDGIVINSITTNNKKNTGFLPYDSRVKNKSLYFWMSGLLAPIELVKIYERIENYDTVNILGGTLPVENVDRDGNIVYGPENDRIRWRQVWAFPNSVDGINMKYFANLTEMYVYADTREIPLTLFYADPS